MITSKLSNQGDLGELILTTELVSRGLVVSIPFGSSHSYDLVVECKDGRLLKVQVKSTNRLKSKVSFKFNCIDKYIGKVDVLAFLCKDSWYFYDKDTMGKLAHYQSVIIRVDDVQKNNWGVFGCVV